MDAGTVVYVVGVSANITDKKVQRFEPGIASDLGNAGIRAFEETAANVASVAQAFQLRKDTPQVSAYVILGKQFSPLAEWRRLFAIKTFEADIQLRDPGGK